MEDKSASVQEFPLSCCCCWGRPARSFHSAASFSLCSSSLHLPFCAGLACRRRWRTGSGSVRNAVRPDVNVKLVISIKQLSSWRDAFVDRRLYVYITQSTAHCTATGAFAWLRIFLPRRKLSDIRALECAASLCWIQRSHLEEYRSN